VVVVVVELLPEQAVRAGLVAALELIILVRLDLEPLVKVTMAVQHQQVILIRLVAVAVLEQLATTHLDLNLALVVLAFPHQLPDLQLHTQAVVAVLAQHKEPCLVRVGLEAAVLVNREAAVLEVEQVQPTLAAVAAVRQTLRLGQAVQVVRVLLFFPSQQPNIPTQQPDRQPSRLLVVTQS